MARRKTQSFSRPVILMLFAAVLWTFFQPVFTIKLSSFSARSWSSWQLSQSFFGTASKFISPKKKSMIDVDINTSFTDLLKKIFPRKKSQWNWKSSAGFALGILIPSALALAYLCLFAGAGTLLLKSQTGLSRLTGLAAAASFYALAGVLYLGEKAEDIFRVSAEQASQGILGLFARPFVPQMSLEPGIALFILPLIAAAIWILSRLRSK